jgi:hypothetical protein
MGAVRVKGWPSRERWHEGVAFAEVPTRRPHGGRQVTVVAVAGLVLSLAATACAPQSPDRSSWIDQAHTALDDVSSEVATVSLLLHLQDEDKVPGKYQQVVAQDSESAVGKTMSKFSGEQPPEGEDDTYRDVTAVMSEASDLLAEVRIAIVRRATGEYPTLREQLVTMQDQLTQQTDELEGPGR